VFLSRLHYPPTSNLRTYFSTPKVCVEHSTFGSSEQPFSKISVLFKCSLMDIKSALLDLFVKLEKMFSGHRQWASKSTQEGLGGIAALLHLTVHGTPYPHDCATAPQTRG
jgi:hypothetical protein